LQFRDVEFYLKGWNEKSNERIITGTSLYQKKEAKAFIRGSSFRENDCPMG
jgi:hypothetical protein